MATVVKSPKIGAALLALFWKPVRPEKVVLLSKPTPAEMKAPVPGLPLSE